MTQSENFSRPNKGILKWSKPLLSRSASLQSKRTCFKEESTASGVDNLSKTFNFGCSLDVPDWPCTEKNCSRKSFEKNDEICAEIIPEDEVVQSYNTDFIERRKSFEMKANVDNFQGVVDLRAVLAHRIPDLEPEDDEEEKSSSKFDQKKPGPTITAQLSTDHSSIRPDCQHCPDVEMVDN